MEMNFCPYCNAAQHKLMNCADDIFFCKDCNRFFSFKALELKCPKCDKTSIRKSDFPSPNGEAVFQCNSCKKSVSASDFFKYNKLK